MWVRVARIGKPFGVKGLVTVQVVTDAPEQRLAAGASLSLADDGNRPVGIDTAQRMGNRWVLGLAGVDDRDAAERMRGEELFAESGDVTPGSDEWFDWQLIGLPCRSVAGDPLGEIVAVEHPPAQDLIVVRAANGELIRVPFVAALVPEVSTDVVTLDPPGGLFDAAGDGQA